MPKKVVQVHDGAQKGNFTYSQAIRKGNMIFISGVTGQTDENGKILSKGDIKAQAKECYEKIKKILESVGATMNDVVKTTDFVTTFEGYKNTAEVRRDVFGTDFPAATGVLVSGLVRRDALIEIEVIAIVD